VEEEGSFLPTETSFSTLTPRPGDIDGAYRGWGLRVASPAFGKGNFQLDTLSSSRSLLAQLGIEDELHRCPTLQSTGPIQSSRNCLP